MPGWTRARKEYAQYWMVGFLSPTRHTFQNPGAQRKTPWPRGQAAAVQCKASKRCALLDPCPPFPSSTLLRLKPQHKRRFLQSRTPWRYFPTRTPRSPKSCSCAACGTAPTSVADCECSLGLVGSSDRACVVLWRD